MLCIAINKVGNKVERMPENPHDNVEMFSWNFDLVKYMQVNAFIVLIQIWCLLILSLMLMSPVMIVHKKIIDLLITGLCTVNEKLEMVDSNNFKLYAIFVKPLYN